MIRLLPSHTTVRTGPYTAVRNVEVQNFGPSARTDPRTSGFTTALYPRGFTPALKCELRLRGHLVHGLPTVHGRFALLSVQPFASRRSYHRSSPLLRPLLTSRSTAHSFRQCCPFRHEARSPQVRTLTFPAQSPDLRSFPLVRELRGHWPARPGQPRLISDFCSSTRGFASRFFQRHPREWSPCGSLGSLEPSSQRTHTP